MTFPPPSLEQWLFEWFAQRPPINPAATCFSARASLLQVIPAAIVALRTVVAVRWESRS